MKKSCRNIFSWFAPTPRVKMSRTRMCIELVDETIIGDSWEGLEIQRRLREILEGGTNRKEKVEKHLSEGREVEEATSAMLAEVNLIDCNLCFKTL